MTTEELRKDLKNTIEAADPKLLRMLTAISNEYNDVESERESATEQETESKTSDELYRLVYTSARKENCDDRDIKEILEASRRNNKPLGVTGILIHTNDRFLQVLEGEREKVTQLYDKIALDPRHAGSIMRFCEPVTERYFGDWDMASKQMNSTDVEYNTSISEDKKELYASMLNGDIHSYKDQGMRVLKTFILFS